MISPYYTIIDSNIDKAPFCKLNCGDLEYDSIARKSCIRPDHESAEDLLEKVIKLNAEDIKFYQDKLKGNINQFMIDAYEKHLQRCQDADFQIIYVNFSVATGNEP